MKQREGDTFIPNESIRQACEKSSLSLEDIAIITEIDTRRLTRMLGRGYEAQKNITSSLAKKIVEAIGKDPVDFDF